MEIGPVTDEQRPPVDAILKERWGDALVVHDTEFPVEKLSVLAARDAEGILGLATFSVEGEGLEVVTLDSLREGRSVGRTLIQALIDEARQRGLARVWLITTNENLQALAFFQRRGFRIVRVDPGAADRARQKKPSIPEAVDGIPIHDELELELRLT